MENKLKYSLITINREYAAYGHTIAGALSERLGLPYYDKDFIEETAKASGYDKEEIAREGEDMSRSSKFMNSLLNNATVYSSSYDNIFLAQREVIINLSKQPCIIVGRCSDFVLKEAGIPRFSIFLYADWETRLKRAFQLEENQDRDLKNVAKYISRRDIMRKTYYKEYTRHDMDDCRNYNLALDVGTLGVDCCVDMICRAVMEDK